MAWVVRKLDGFLLGLLAAIVLAWLWPEPGKTGGVLHPEVLTKVGVALVFFFHGAGLSFASLRAGTLEWRLHLTIQSITFIAFPLVGSALATLAPSRLPEDLVLGFAFLCALPSTVSSSVALTATSGGNVAVAIFNAGLSSLVGVVLTPLWMGLVTERSSSARPFSAVVLDLVLWLLLPIVVGQLSRRWFAGVIAARRRLVHRFDRFVILLLVYTSFSDSVARGVWTASGARVLSWTLAGVGLLFLTVLTATYGLCDARRLSHSDKVAVIFCATTKSLATGVPMAQIMFGGAPGLGLILLPILVYHPLQLLVGGVLANRWARTLPTTSPSETAP